MNNSSNNR